MGIPEKINQKNIPNNFYRPNNNTGNKQYRINGQIRVPNVDLIDQNGQRLGIVNTKEALAMAENNGLDLVEVAPLASTPVCKIMDYGKFLYQQRRSQHKNKTLDTKGIRLSFKIAPHDLEVRIKQAEKFLNKGHKVKVELRLRGREKAFRNQAKGVIQNFLNQISGGYKADKNIEVQGPTLSILVYKK